ncbi:hypothetical protein BASA81_001222 [Batrachochytrium salamandrivorans]|nr:hypothetical protein BASA81_001222 [Batrachochytrium salamandrivorans]
MGSGQQDVQVRRGRRELLPSIVACPKHDTLFATVAKCDWVWIGGLALHLPADLQEHDESGIVHRKCF